MKRILLFLMVVFYVNAKAQCPPVTIASEYGIICNSQSNQFIASGGTTYQWKPLPLLSSSTNGDTVVVRPSTNSTYTVTATTGTCVATNTITLIVNSCTPPKVGFLTNTDTICVNHCIVFKDTTQFHSTKPLFYKWAFPGGSISAPQGSTIHNDTLFYTMTTSAAFNPIKVCYHVNSILNNNGFFPVTQIVTNGIRQTNTYTDSVMVAPGPIVNFNLVQDAAPHTWNAMVNYQTYVGVTSAIWYWGDGASTMGLYPSHTYTTPGRYIISVMVTDRTGCTDSISQSDSLYRLANSTMVYVNVKNSLSGISMINNQNTTVQIYPNPAQTNFTVETNSSEKQTLQVFDVNGKMILSQSIINNTTIDVNYLNAGVYNLSLLSSNGVINKKLVIVK